MKTSHGRIPELDGLRACAVLAIFCSHAFGTRMLWIGVDLFFVLSGFLITGILVDLKHKDLRGYFAHFYARRARRILPPYVLFLFVTSLFFGFWWLKRWYMYLGLMNYLIAMPGAYYFAFNHLWSLAVEEQFYAVWPLAVYFLSAKKIPYLAAVLMVLAPVFRVLMIPYDHVHQIVYMGTPFRMDCLAMGSILTFVWRSKRETIRRFGFLGLSTVVITPLLMMQLSKLGGWSTMDGTVKGNVLTYEIALATATGIFLWGLGGRFTWLLTTAPFQFLGRVSYSFYLSHALTLHLRLRRFGNEGTNAALAFSVALGYATLSWYLMERPILAGGDRRVKTLEVEAADSGPERHDDRRAAEHAAG